MGTATRIYLTADRNHPTLRLRVACRAWSAGLAARLDQLPSPANGFDDPAQLDAFLDAVRWGAIASADKTVLQAPFRSGIQTLQRHDEMRDKFGMDFRILDTEMLKDLRRSAVALRTVILEHVRVATWLHSRDPGQALRRFPS